MYIPLFAFFFSLSAFSQSSPRIEVIPEPKKMEDYEHQYKGCLENSECDQVMGLQLSRWKTLIEKVRDEKIEPAKKAQFLELFRSKYGIPVEFYTYQKSRQGFKPLLFNSHCRDHNPKEGDKVLKGTAFLKGLTAEKATVWRDQTQIEVPVGDILIPQPVLVYTEAEPQKFMLPIGDQPLFIKDKSLYVLKEDEDFFYFLKAGPDGSWKIENIDLTKLGQWEEKREEVPCPKGTGSAPPKEFKVEFCKSIWNEDQKKPVVVKLRQGCST